MQTFLAKPIVQSYASFAEIVPTPTSTGWDSPVPTILLPSQLNDHSTRDGYRLESRRWDGEQGTVELGRAPPLVELVDARQGAVSLFRCRTKRTASPAGRWPPEVPDWRCVIRRRRRYRASNEVRAKLPIMASSAVPVSAAGSANETLEIPDNVGDWLRGVYRFATDRNDFRRNLILNLGLFAAGVWLARNLSDIDLMAPQPGV